MKPGWTNTAEISVYGEGGTSTYVAKGKKQGTEPSLCNLLDLKGQKAGMCICACLLYVNSLSLNFFFRKMEVIIIPTS